MDWNKFGNTLVRYRYALSLIGTTYFGIFVIKPIKIYQYEKHKKEISSDLKKLINEVISDFALNKSLMKDMLFRFDNKLFASSLGFYRMPPKQIMLLPEYLCFTSTNEISNEVIKSYLQQFFNVRTSEKKQVLNNYFINEFKESLILSPKAKKFIIAQQFNNFKTQYCITKMLIVLSSLIIALEIIKYFIMIAPKVPFSYIANAILSIACCITFAYIKTNYNYQYLNSIAFALTKDKSTHSNLIFMAKNDNLSLIDDDYYQGALDYFESLAKRNRAVRSIALNESFFSLKRFTISEEGLNNKISSYTYNINRIKQIKMFKKIEEDYCILY